MNKGLTISFETPESINRDAFRAGQQDILRRLREPSEAVRGAALSAEAEAERNPPMQPCRRCKGQGYHHGFCEDGHDPDWCDSCGGGQYELGDPAYLVRAALTAAADAIEKEVAGE